MTEVGRYWRLFRVQVRSSVLLGLSGVHDVVLVAEIQAYKLSDRFFIVHD